MGVPSYVINFDELSDLLKDYLQNGIDVDIGNVTFSTAELLIQTNWTWITSIIQSLGLRLRLLES